MLRKIVFIEGTPHPILCNKIRYYEDGYFKPRLLGASGVPRLETEQRTAFPDTATAKRPE